MPRQTLTRRQMLAAFGGAATLGITAPQTLLAAKLPPAETTKPRTEAASGLASHLAWVWQFLHDGSPYEIRETLAAHNLGIALKAYDGVNWMGRYDSTPSAVTSAADVASYARFFENGGVPFHAWGVVKGIDPAREARIASDVLNAGARSLFLDVEPHDGFWVGSSESAQRLGQELRRMQPNAWLSTSVDPRPWVLDRTPLAEFTAFTDEISPQVYWDTFSNAANVRRYVSSGVLVGAGGVTPGFVIEAAMARLSRFGRPIHPIGDGTVSSTSAWGDFLGSSYGVEADAVSVWRYGVADRQVWRFLADNPPRVGTYTVQPGDSLAAIASRHGTTTGALAEANGIGDPNLIRIGAVLRVPRGGAVATVAAAPAPAPAARGGSYTVQPGDSLSRIASRHGTTTSAIASANGISNPNLIRIGQVLALP